jgi:uncharacterized protein
MPELPVRRPICEIPIPEMMAPPRLLLTTSQASAPCAYDDQMPDELPPRIPPPITDLSRPFWTGGADGKLLISQCRSCARWTHPPAALCDDCGGELVPQPVSGRGSVFTFTVNRHPYNPAVPVPYVIAIVELDEQTGLRFTTDLVDCGVEEVYIGMPVEVTFEQTGEAWVPLFRPARQSSEV